MWVGLDTCQPSKVPVRLGLLLHGLINRMGTLNSGWGVAPCLTVCIPADPEHCCPLTTWESLNSDAQVAAPYHLDQSTRRESWSLRKTMLVSHNVRIAGKGRISLRELMEMYTPHSLCFGVKTLRLQQSTPFTLILSLHHRICCQLDQGQDAAQTELSDGCLTSLPSEHIAMITSTLSC